tara:strand:+ start:138 stop:581 length:444 start_codon:yes stop_codon:yes gene_type:complete
MDPTDEFLSNLEEGGLDEEGDSNVYIIKDSSPDCAVSNKKFWVSYKVVDEDSDENFYETRVSKEHSRWVVYEFREGYLDDGVRITEKPLLFDEALEIAREGVMNHLTDLFVADKICAKKTDLGDLIENPLPLSLYEMEMVLSGGRSN